jgi:cobalamin biosynthesis Mg chelatase CobN
VDTEDKAESRTKAKDPKKAKDPISEETREKAKDATATRRSADAERRRPARAQAPANAPSPAWLAPTAVVLLIVGLLYLVVYYLSQGLLPLPVDRWNLLIGFGIMGIGGISLMFWK